MAGGIKEGDKDMNKNQIELRFLIKYRLQYEAIRKRYEDIEKSNLPNKNELLEQIKTESEEIADKMITEVEWLRKGMER